jgi:hypothetical protein
VTRRPAYQLLPVPDFPDTLVEKPAAVDPDRVYWTAVLAPDRVTLVGLRGKNVVVSAFHNITKSSPDDPQWRNQVSTALRAMKDKLTEDWVAYACQLNQDYGVEVRLEQIEC